jgi:magnesium chelatase family protein
MYAKYLLRAVFGLSSDQAFFSVNDHLKSLHGKDTALQSLGVQVVSERSWHNGILSTQGCKCGYFGSSRECKCSPAEIQRYVGKISGPLLDRIDIHIDVPAVKFNELRGRSPEGDSSETIRERVMRARDVQLARFDGEGVFSNSAMSPKQIRTFCALDAQSEDLLEKAMLRQGLSARAHDRILKVSRTIADLDGSENIQPNHISEAINYRSLDRNYWT